MDYEERVPNLIYFETIYNGCERIVDFSHFMASSPSDNVELAESVLVARGIK